MRIECPKCHKKYEVEEAYIPIGGGPVRCPNCSNIFGIFVEPMDIPLTPILEDEEASPSGQEETQFSNPELGETSFSPEHQPIPQPALQTQETASLQQDESSISDLGSFSSHIDTNENVFGANIPDQSAQPAMPSFDAGNYQEPVQEQTINQSFSNDIPPFAQQEAPAPSFEQPAPLNPFSAGNPFASPSDNQPSSQDSPPFTQQTPEQSPFAEANPFAIPVENVIQHQQIEEPSPFAAPSQNPFIQQQPVQSEQNKPSLNTSAFMTPETVSAESSPPPTQNPFMQQTAPVQEEPQSQKQIQPEPAKKVVGGSFMDTIMKEYSLPANYSTMPETVQKLHKDAIKIARQLAKDILLYHKDTVDKGMSAGNLKEILNDEIEKSYKFYTQRVQPEICNSSNYFSEALNIIVANGQKIF